MADWTPQSRAEEILFKTINGEPYDGLPQSRIEELLLELKEVIEQGGARATWWTASATSGSSTNVVHVNDGGTSDSGNASYAICVPVCFRTMEA